MATPLEGIEVIPNAIANALAPLYDAIVGGEEEVPWEYRFGEPGYRENLGGYYPAAPPLDVTNPYTETYRSDILPRTSEDFTKVITGPSGKYIQGYDVGAGPFAQVEQELLARQDERQRQVDSNTPTSYMTGATVKRYDGGLKETIHAPRIDFYPDNRTVFSGGVRQVIEPSFADQVEAERQGIQFDGAVQRDARAQAEAPAEALFWTPPLKGTPVYPPSFKQETIDILEANPGLDSDMVRHYVHGKEIGEKWGPIISRMGIYGKEAADLLQAAVTTPAAQVTPLGRVLGNLPINSRAAFSLDDLLASEAGLQNKSVKEALDANVFKHTESGITGYGQGKWDEVKQKAEDLGLKNPLLLQHEVRGPSGPSTRTRIRLDPAKEAAATMGYLKPEEFGLDPFTNEQVAEARATFQRLMEETPEEVSQYISPTADPYIYQDQVAEALQKAQAEQTLFTGEEVDVASRAPLNMANIMRAINRNAPSTGIGTDIVEPTVDPSPFIGEPGFTPSLGGHTLGSPVVGTTQAGVPSGFEALASLIQDDPSVAQKYISGAGPTAELANLVANTGVETFTDFPTEQPGAEIPWTPPAPDVPDITEELVDFSAIQSAREAEAQKAQDKIDRQLEHAANVRRKDEEKARLASARNAKAEQRRIDKENKERAAEEKRIAASQAAAEKKRRATEKQMADMLKRHNEAHQAYLDRKRKEEDRRKRQGYGVGGMWT